MISNDESVWNDNELLLLYHLAGLIISTYVMIYFLTFTSMIWKSTNACPNFASTNAACPLSLKCSKLTSQQMLIRLARHNQCTDWWTSKKTTDFTTDNKNSYTYTSFNGVLMVLEFHHNKLSDIWVLLEGKYFNWMSYKLSLFTSAFKKTFHGTHMFADWLEFASAFSIFLENEISNITRGNKQLNFLEISFTGYLAPTQQSKRKRNLTFSDNARWAQLTSGPNAER